MITEKITGAVTELRALAGEVPAEVWQRLRPIVGQLAGMLEPLEEMERQGIAPAKPTEEEAENA